MYVVTYYKVTQLCCLSHSFIFLSELYNTRKNLRKPSPICHKRPTIYLFAVTMDTECHMLDRSYKLNENQPITLQWKGDNPGIYGCKYRFNGVDMWDALKEYEVCVETKEIFLQDKGIHVKFNSNGGFSYSVVRKVTFYIICYTSIALCTGHKSIFCLKYHWILRDADKSRTPIHCGLIQVLHQAFIYFNQQTAYTY